MDNIFNIIWTGIISVGGLSAIIIGLASWIGEIWANNLAEKYKAKIEKEIENYKSEINMKLNKLDKIEEKALYISKVNFDNEYKIYMEIWPKLIECVNKTLMLYPQGIENVPIDKEELEKYKEDKYKQFADYYNDYASCINKYAPFYQENFFNDLNEIKKSCFFIGDQYKMYEFDVKYNQSFVGSRDLVMNTKERKEIYQNEDKIINLKEELLIKIRTYLNGLKLNDEK